MTRSARITAQSGISMTLCVGALLFSLPAQSEVPSGLPSPKQIPAPPQPNAFPLGIASSPSALQQMGAEIWDKLGPDTVVRNVSTATLTAFLPDPAHATGAAVVVAPGGGFMILSIKNEGWDVGRWLADHGVAAFVLKYRVKPTPPDDAAFEAFASQALFRPLAPGERRITQAYAPAVEDGVAAVALIKAKASQWGIDPKRVGMIGFSAGASTTLHVALESRRADRPAFIGLIYNPPANITVSPDSPPLFAAVAADDPIVGPDTAVTDAWRSAGRPVEFHLYEKGGHGFGMRRSGNTTDLWPEEFLYWLRSNGFLSQS